MKHHQRAFFAILFFLGLSACQAPIQDSPTAPADYCASAGISNVEEIAECSSSTSYGSGVTITGTAGFFKRDINVTTASGNVTKMTLGAPISSALPIKYAEIRVLNSSGTVVQCGRTDATGALKALDGTSDLIIPGTIGNYTVEVLSRTNHSVSVPGGKSAFKLYTSVKSVCSNSVHKITSTISSSGASSYSTTLTAYAKESQSAAIAGGAFNIFNDLGVVYDYLAQHTGTSNLSCLNSKLHVYWNAGFNPAQLIDPSSDPSTLDNISYYLRGYNELYINGGKIGNVSEADTDHFDDSVIIHEIGHHLENSCGKMESPGGSHYGQFRIDPRLAWSEGWGNFFGAHILRNNLASINPDLSTTLSGYDGWLYYLDTSGYKDGLITTGDELIRFNLSKPGSTSNFDKVDSVSYPGEGHFREVAVSRSLFKSTNTCTSTGKCSTLDYFAKMWEAFENDASKSGMGKSIYPFRSSIRFYERLGALSVSGTMPTEISTILNSDEAQQLPGNSSYVTSGTTTWVPYGVKLVSSPTQCNLAIQPRNEDFNVTYIEPDQRYSNHFYYFDRNAIPTVTDIYLSVTKASGTDTDIDLILYGDKYRFPTETCTNSDCTTSVKNTNSGEFVRADRSIGSGPTYIKHISGLNSLSFSLPYLLNIRAYTTNVTITNTTQYTYSLTDQNGGYLCPSATY